MTDSTMVALIALGASVTYLASSPHVLRRIAGAGGTPLAIP